MNVLKKEENLFLEILNRVKSRNFSGNTGFAVKNSIYQTSNSIVAKIGSLIFMLILPGLLLPELFGLYNLALSTIFLFSAISSLGIGETLTTFVSRELGKGREAKAKAYLVYIGKIKLFFITLSILILILTAKLISNNYYHKPVFLALIAGGLYVVFSESVNFFSTIFQSSNFFKGVYQKEIVFQVSRLLLVPLIVIFSLRNALSQEMILFYLILGLGICYLITTLFMVLISKKNTHFLKFKNSELNNKQKTDVNKFLKITAVFTISGMFFSYIDKIILGPFVGAEFIGYYSLAFSLISSFSAFLGFNAVLLPLFSRMKRKRLQVGMDKAIGVTFLLGLFLSIIAFFSAKIVILTLWPEYALSINLLRLFSVLLVIIPLIGVYSVYFISSKRPQIVAKLLFLSTVVNLLLTYTLVISLIKYGDLAAVYGAAIAGILSQIVYLAGLAFYKNRQE